MRLLGISRGASYSPNLQDSDAAIFAAVAHRLREGGAVVDCIGEDHLLATPLAGYAVVFTMARDVESLARWVCPLPCSNSPAGILACSRKGLAARLLAQAGVRQPRFAADAGEADFFPLWLKNGDSCAQRREDTVLVPDAGALRAALAAFRERGVRSWLLQAHVEGDLLKFYGVEGTDFFEWHYAAEGHSKFGLEVHNGPVQGFRFDAAELKRLADRAARTLGVPIYGGDCVVDRTGALHLIDFNDWPSFARCRERAAEAIARRILSALIPIS